MMLDAVRRDMKLAIRSLRRAPGFSVGTIAILGLGIGLSTTMFGLYKSVIADRLPVAAQDQLVVMNPRDRGNTRLDVPYRYLAEIARDSSLFSGVAGVYHLNGSRSPFTDGNTTRNLAALDASPNFFAVLGMRPILGRLFVPEDGQAGAPFVLVLSYDAWQRQFGGDSGVIGRALVAPYTGNSHRIIGVAPAGFSYPIATEAWIPMQPSFNAQVDIIARLAPRVTIERASSALLARMQRSNPFLMGQWASGKPPDLSQFKIFGIEARSFADTILGKSRPAIGALTAAVALLLLIACVNVGNLALVRSLGRAREIAVRRAIGASYADVTRLFLIENGLLAIVGGAVGFALAIGLIRVVSALGPELLPRVDTIGETGTALAIAGGTTVVALLLFGLAPSLVASRVQSYAALRADVRAGSEGRRRRNARRWLVSSQMALAVMLLAGAGLLVRTLARLEAMELGYRAEHLAMLSFTGPQRVLSSNEKIFEASKSVVAHIEALPGVIAATPIESPPFRGQSLFIMKIAPADVPASERERFPFTPFEFVGPNYFRTFQIPIRRGRAFAASDTKASGNVVVISETLAQRLWPKQDAVGKKIVQMINQSEWTVVGVASDTHLRELKNGGPVAYFNGDQIAPFWNGYLAVRTTAPISTMLPAIRAATHDANPSLVLYDTKTMDELLAEPLAQPRLSALLLSGFSTVALLLSAIGLYGVLSSMVRQQTRDLGIRLALGATGRDIRRLVLGDAMRVVGIGAVVGIVGAVAGGRLLASQLYGVGFVDPLSLGAISAVLLASATLAASLPARRASRIDPAQALRAE